MEDVPRAIARSVTRPFLSICNHSISHDRLGAGQLGHTPVMGLMAAMANGD